MKITFLIPPSIDKKAPDRNFVALVGILMGVLYLFKNKMFL